MQPPHVAPLLAAQLLLQEVPEQMVIAIPLALVVQRQDEQVSGFQGLQDLA